MPKKEFKLFESRLRDEFLNDRHLRAAQGSPATRGQVNGCLFLVRFLGKQKMNKSENT